MSKKVLVLSSSPRKGGNSEVLCDEFFKGAKESGNKVEKIVLKDKEIHNCIACDSCKNNNGKCIWMDDMAEILDKMIESDVIAMATPVYFYTICAQMKTLIDRTVARYTEIKNKEFYFIITAADYEEENLERTLECFRGFTDCLSGVEEKGVLYGTGVWNKGEVEGSNLMKQAYEMGKNI